MNEQELQKQDRSLYELLNNPSTSIQELVGLIEHDKVLSERILSKANSAIYGMRRRVTSLREAVVLIGFKNLREIIAARHPAPDKTGKVKEMGI